MVVEIRINLFHWCVFFDQAKRAGQAKCGARVRTMSVLMLGSTNGADEALRGRCSGGEQRRKVESSGDERDRAPGR